MLTLGADDKIDSLFTEENNVVTVPEYINAVTLENSMTIKTSENTIFNGITVKSGTDITVDGDMISIGDTKVYHKMSVKGDYIQKKRSLYVGANSVMNTEGNVQFVEEGGLSGTAGSAVINIGKDFIYDSPKSCTLYSGNGTWYNEGRKITDSAFSGKPSTYTINMKVGDEKDIVFNNVFQDVTFISNKNAVAYCDSNLKIHARSKGKANLTTKINGANVTVKVIVG